MDSEQRKSLWWMGLFLSLFVGILAGMDKLLRNVDSFEMDRVDRHFETMMMTVWFPGFLLLICLSLIRARWFLRLLMLWVPLPFMWITAMGAFMVVNVHFDSSEPREVQATVVERKITRRHRHMLKLQLGDVTTSTLRVSAAFYSGVREGDRLCMKERRGFLGVSWVKTFELCGAEGE